MLPRLAASVAALVVVALALIAAPAQADVVTRTHRVGPIELAPFGTNVRHGIAFKPVAAGYLVAMRARLVEATGEPIPNARVMLHHVWFGTKGRRVPGSCPGGRTEPFYGTGEELQELALPPGYGYRFSRRDRWTVNSMVMNHEAAHRSVYLEYTVAVERRRELFGVRPFWARITGRCTDPPEYDIPGSDAPGTIDRRSTNWRAPITGRLVAAGTHLHGGAYSMTLSQPRCGGRALYRADASYAPADDLLYSIRPLLHEPSPSQTTHLLSGQGIPVRRGEMLRLHSRYDGTRPHMRVMAVMHLYIAPRAARVPSGCTPLPPVTRSRPADGTRPAPPSVDVRLHAVGADGVPAPFEHPTSPLTLLAHDATVDVRDDAFDNPYVSIPSGATLTWRFRDSAPHNVTLANGPRAVASRAFMRAGETYRRRFTVPGTYRLFCDLHPMTMHEVVEVRP